MSIIFNHRTGLIETTGASGITVKDSGGTDSIAIAHDGTDANIDFVNTTDLNINDGVEFKLWNSGGTSHFRALHTSQSVLDSTAGDFVFRTTAASTNMSFYVGGTGEADEAFRLVDSTAAIVRNGLAFRVSDTTDADYLQIQHDGTDANVTFAGTTDLNIDGAVIRMTNTGGVRVQDGASLRIQDSTDTDYIDIVHDGTDVNFTHATTTDWNITGITSIQAGTVDADFDAITATSYGGITEANLVDKTATETISGEWTFTSDNVDLESTTPFIRITETGVTNTPEWWWGADGGNFSLRLNNTGLYPITFVTNATNDALVQVHLGNYDFDVDQTVGAGQDGYVLTYDNGTGLISLEAATGSGTVTSVAAGNGMDFTTITTTGTVTMGTPGTLTASTSNATTTTSHTHSLDNTVRQSLTDNASITTAGWYRIATNSAAAGRGAATFYISNAGGGDGPAPAIFRITKSYQATLTDASITVLDSIGHNSESLQQIRIIFDQVTNNEIHVEVFIGTGTAATWTHHIVPDNSLGTWASVDYTTGATADFALTWDLATENVKSGTLTGEGMATWVNHEGFFEIAGRNATSANSGIVVDARGDAYLQLLADRSSDTELENAYVLWSQDATAVQTVAGTVGGANIDSQNGTFTGMTNNGFGIHHRFATGAIGLGVNQRCAVLINDSDQLIVQEPTSGDSVAFSHDGTDFNIAGSATTDINVTGLTTLNVAGRGYFSGVSVGGVDGSTLTLDSSNTQFSMVDSDGAANAKVWNWVAGANTYSLRTLDDTWGSANTALQFTRSGVSVTAADITATTFTVNSTGSHNFYSGDTESVARFGRNANENIRLDVNDAAGGITLDQDETDATAHTMYFNMETANTGTRRMEFRENNVSKFQINHDLDNIWIRDGYALRIYDSTDADYIQIAHDGTDANITTAGTTNINVGTDIQMNANIVSTVNDNQGIEAGYLGVNSTTGSDGHGLSLYNGYVDGEPTYGIMFAQTATFGSYGNATGDWNTYFTMNSTANRGWAFKVSAGSVVASIENTGYANFPRYYPGNQTTKYMDVTTGYGSVNVAGGGTSSYAGYSINNDIAFMSNGTTHGLYNAGSSEWIIQTTDSAAVKLFYNNTESLSTQLYSTTGNTSGAVVRDHANVLRDVGFNHVKEVSMTTANITLDDIHAGTIIRRTGTSAVTLTVAAGAGFPNGSMVTVLNHGTGGSLTISDGAEAMYIMNGSGTVTDSAGFVLAIGGCITIWRQGTSAFYVWGTGIP